MNTSILLTLLLAANPAASLLVAADPSGDTASEAADYGDELPRYAPVDPAAALETFVVKPPFHVELAAAEPLVHDPVAMAFDPDGRLYVVEMRGYSEQRDERLSAVRLLEDTTGDGRFDRSTVFAGELRWPTAVACWDGGVFVADAPDVWFMKDVDGDRKADVKERVLTGFSHHNVQAMLNSLEWGLDNRLHCTVSTGGAEVQRVGDESAEPLVLRTRDFSFDPRTRDLAPTSLGGQHGMTFDDWGRKFVCTNSSHIMQVMYPDRYAARNPYLATAAPRILIAADGAQPDVFRLSPLEPWRILRTKLRLEGTLMQFRLEGGGRAAGYLTAASGVTVYRGDDWPDEYRGTAVVGDVGSNLIHRMRLEPNGVEFVARRMDERSELLASTDTWFRPVQFVVGPDGCLYVADMYREIIEHPDSFGDVIKKHLHLTSGRDRGRIYRIRAASGTSTTAVGARAGLGRASTEDLVQLLAHENSWHRETAARLLYQRQDEAAVEPLKGLARKSPSPLGRMHALSSLAGLAALSEDDVSAGLSDPEPRVREHAVRLAEDFIRTPAQVGRMVASMADDPDLGVRFQLAFSLGELQSPDRFGALAAIARRDGDDRWIRAAVLTSLGEGADVVFAELIGDDEFRSQDQVVAILPELARVTARRNDADEVRAVVDGLGLLGEDEQELAVAVVRGTGLGIGRRQSVLQGLLESKTPTSGVRRFRRIVGEAAEIAANAGASTSQRVDAVQLLGLSALADVRPTLIGLLDSSQPLEVGRESLAVLNRLRDPDLAELVVDVWPRLTPGLREAAMELLVVQPDRVPTLLAAIEKGQLNPGDLTARQVQRVCLHKDDTVRERAVRLLSPTRPGQRAEIVAAYRPALDSPGDVVRGREVFRKICATCHKAEGVGHELGPNLATFAHRGPEAIMVSVLDPNREVNPLYATYTVVTTDGQVLTGMLTAETATAITLTREEGKSDVVLRGDIEEFRANNISLMPEGLEKKLTPPDMSDVIAYLTSLR